MKTKQHVVNPVTGQWYGLDEHFNVWTYSEDMSAALNVTQTPELVIEAKVAELRRAVQEARKALGLIPSEFYPDTVTVDASHAHTIAIYGKAIAKLCLVHSVDVPSDQRPQAHTKPDA